MGPEERAHFTRSRMQLGVGEASCLAIAIVRRYDFLSDEMI
jgi:predicted nucleic acid-binding protein